MVGPVVDLAAATIHDLPEVTGSAWVWDATPRTYRAVSSDGMLERGRGYWVYATAPVEVDTLTLDVGNGDRL